MYIPPKTHTENNTAIYGKNYNVIQFQEMADKQRKSKDFKQASPTDTHEVIDFLKKFKEKFNII